MKKHSHTFCYTILWSYSAYVKLIDLFSWHFIYISFQSSYNKNCLHFIIYTLKTKSIAPVVQIVNPLSVSLHFFTAAQFVKVAQSMLLKWVWVCAFVLFNDAWCHLGHLVSYTTSILASKLFKWIKQLEQSLVLRPLFSVFWAYLTVILCAYAHMHVHIILL